MNIPLIQFLEVTKAFGAQQVLKGINLSIFHGEILAVIGKSGTGKSVLLKHIIGLIHPDSGQILINGEPMDTLAAEKRTRFRKELSYMFQENALFDFMTIYDNIALPLVENSAYPRDRIKPKVMTRIAQLGLSGDEKKYPAQLSGGMRKRVALARALVTDPSVVLFDEPTAGLDPVRKRKVHSMIIEYQKKFGFTAVVVSHDIPEIFNVAQRIAMLDNGLIRFEGSKKEIFDVHGNVLKDFAEGIDV